MSIMLDFSAASGTSINPLKSNLFFFNTQLPRRNIAKLLAIPISTLPFTYLGVPLTDKPLSPATWKNLIKNMEKIISNWTFRYLNLASCLILVKSVLQAIPIYLYSTLVAPKVISNKIRNLHRNFLWRGAKVKHKWALVAWEKNLQAKKKMVALVLETETSWERPWEPKTYGDGLKTPIPLAESYGKQSKPPP